MAPVTVYSIFFIIKPSDSPVHDCIKENHETLAKEDVDFQKMDYSDDGHFDNKDEKPLLDLVPSVLETMNNHGKVDIYGHGTFCIQFAKTC
jgi:hypothetical protein